EAGGRLLGRRGGTDGNGQILQGGQAVQRSRIRLVYNAHARRSTKESTRMIRLTTDPIDYHALTEQVRRADCGGVVVFLGTVRDLTGDRVTVALDYEAYPGMAEKKMAEIEADTRGRWAVGEIALIHRPGRLEVGDVR